MGFSKVASGGCEEGVEDFDMSGQVRGDSDGGGTHQSVGRTSNVAKPAFILSSFLILPDSLRGVHVCMITPFVIAIRIPLPLDQVLALPLSSIVAHV